MLYYQYVYMSISLLDIYIGNVGRWRGPTKREIEEQAKKHKHTDHGINNKAEVLKSESKPGSAEKGN